MFDLFKDIDKYKGITPYASEHYGVYQALLGWQSKLTKSWIQRGGVLIDPEVKRVLDARLVPDPLEDRTTPASSWRCRCSRLRAGRPSVSDSRRILKAS